MTDDNTRDLVFEALNNAVENGYEINEPQAEAYELSRDVDGLDRVPVDTLARYVQEWKDEQDG